MLCILASKQVLCTLFVGWQHLLGGFKIFFCQKSEKKRAQKEKKKYMKSKKGVNQHWGASLKCKWPPKAGRFLGRKYKSWKNYLEKNKTSPLLKPPRKRLSRKLYIFPRIPPANGCEAPIPWSKYTTDIIFQSTHTVLYSSIVIWSKPFFERWW